MLACPDHFHAVYPDYAGSDLRSHAAQACSYFLPSSLLDLLPRSLLHLRYSIAHLARRLVLKFFQVPPLFCALPHLPPSPLTYVQVY
jgi:hypothetical protein